MEVIPDNVKKILIENAEILCHKAENDALHRIHFEKQSAVKVRSIFERLQRVFTKKRVLIHNLKGGEHARHQ
jgi:hypothetical protein